MKRIILEEKSTSTSENIKYTNDIIKNKKVTVVIYTSDYHMYRAKMLAKRIGWEAQGHSVKNTFLERVKRIPRECLALIKDTIIR